MIKLIATDMDGTLLKSNNQLPERFPEVFERLQEEGIIFAAASGRQYYNLIKRFEAVQDQMMFIAENGTFVIYKNEEILVKSLDRNDAYELVKIGRTIDEAYIVLCGKKSAYIEGNDERFINEVKKYYERFKVVECLEDVEDEILKVTLCDFKGAEENSIKYFEAFKEDFQVTVSGYLWLDIVANGTNKGVAIEYIQQKLGITPEETMTFGDYLNDLEMMKSAYYSYAMENAHEELKEAARFITQSNDEEGVLIEIERMLNSVNP